MEPNAPPRPEMDLPDDRDEALDKVWAIAFSNGFGHGIVHLGDALSAKADEAIERFKIQQGRAIAAQRGYRAILDISKLRESENAAYHLQIAMMLTVDRQSFTPELCREYDQCSNDLLRVDILKKVVDSIAEMMPEEHARQIAEEAKESRRG